MLLLRIWALAVVVPLFVAPFTSRDTAVALVSISAGIALLPFALLLADCVFGVDDPDDEAW